MKRKFKAKNIIIVLIVLGILAVLTTVFLNTKNSSATNPFNFNITEVTRIDVKLPTSENLITVTKELDNEWYVSNGNQKYKADIRVIANYLNKLQKINPKRIITKKKRDWNKYQVTKSKAIEVKVYINDEKKLLDIFIGKSSSEKATNPFEDDINTTCVRLSDQKTVYETDGLLQKHLNKNINDWRNKLLTKFKTRNIQKISFSNPKESFTMNYMDGNWYYGNETVDTRKVEKYLSNIHFINAYKFTNNFNTTDDPYYELRIEGLDSTIDIKCYKINQYKFVIHSSQNSESFFESDENGLIKQLFKSLEDFQ